STAPGGFTYSMSGCSSPRVAGDSPRANASWMACTTSTFSRDMLNGAPISVSGGSARAGPCDDGVRAVHRRSVRQREDRKLLLPADPLEVGTLPGCAD